MAKKQTVFDIVFKVYSLEYASKEKKEKIRKFINRQLSKEYGKGWDELTPIQKDTFIYVTIRQKMLENYVEYKATEINQNIDRHLRSTLVTSDKQIKTYNSMIDALYENYYEPNDNQTTKKEKFELLCTAINRYNPMVPKPSYEDWLKHPLRPYDYISSFEHDPSQYLDDTLYPTQAEIDHVIIQALLKILCEKSNIEIDVPFITECLYFLKNFDMDYLEPFLAEYDPTINMTQEEQEQLALHNRQYFFYKQKLDNLDFIKKKNGTD